MKSLPDQHQLETLTVLVEGRVQGVGFRAATVRQAHQLKLGGWVRNLLQGPPAARVTGVTHTETPTERHYDRFEQI